MFFLSLFTVFLSLLPFYVKLEQLNVNKWPKWATEYLRRDWALVQITLNYVFLKIYPYDPDSKFQEWEIGSHLTFMQSKIKISITDFSQNKKMWNKK